MAYAPEFNQRIVTGASLSVAAIGLFLLPYWLFALFALAVLFFILTREWPRLFSMKDPRFWFVFPFYPLLSILLMLYLQYAGYEILNLMTVALVGAHDSGSYLIGKHMGRTLINRNISPAKTWEGFAGGVIASLLFSLVFFGHTSGQALVRKVFPFVLTLNGAALAGDLFESSLKRSAGLKDSGSLLPGHGGILDRIDGILFAIVVVFLARDWLWTLLF